MSSSDNTHRILVVDDNAAIHEDFRKIFVAPRSGPTAMERTAVALFGDSSPLNLPEETFAIDSALQGQEALGMVREAAGQERPYLMVFVDIRMPPGWDGIETTVRIWKEFPNQQIIICTAFSDYTWEDIVGRLGQSDRLLILKKPFDVAEVRQLATATITRDLAERQKQEAQELADRVGKDYAKALADSRRMMDALRESEVTIRAIVDTAAEGVILTDEQGIVETFNAAAQDIFGYRADEVCNGPIKRLLVPETYRVFGRFMTSRTDDGEAPVLNADGLAERKDGTRFPVLVAGSQVRLGNRWLFTWLVRDISDRKRAEEQLAVFRRFVDASGQGFGMSDLEGNVTYANPTLRRLVGEENPESTSLDESGMFRRNFTAHYPQELQEKIWNDVIPTVMRRGQWAGKLAMQTSTGRVTPTLENYFLIRDDDGYPICLAFVVTDMTRHERAQQELKEYADALEAANRALKESCAMAEAANRSESEFLANMSHELRTPLHGILSFATFGIQKAATASREDLLRYFQRVDQSGRVLLTLVNDLLDLSKLESGRTSFAMSRMDLVILLRSTADEFNSMVARRNIKIEWV